MMRRSSNFTVFVSKVAIVEQVVGASLESGSGEENAGTKDLLFCLQT